MASEREGGSSARGGLKDWWGALDDLWRWSAHTQGAWLYDLAGQSARSAIRARRIAALLHHARAESPFYREHYRHLSPGQHQLAAFPTVTRSRLMANFDDWVTDRRLRKDELLAFVADPSRIGEPYLDRYAIWTSSGTTGIPGIYVQDSDALAAYSALLSARFQHFDGASSPTAGAARMAMVAAVGHFAGIVSWERQRRLHPAIATRARVFSILDPLPELVARLNDWQPAFIASYPTMLGLLAREVLAGRATFRPHALWSGGEGLSGADRVAIESAFGCPVREDYGASECMNMAFGCSHGRLHLNDDWVVLEPVDEHGRAVPPGQASATVLVTNLANRVQPLIRYDLGDSITIDTEPCACGNQSPTLRVEGRCDDVLVLDARDGDSVRLLPLAIETVIEEEAGVHRFQLIQTAPDVLRVRVDGTDNADCREKFARIADSLTRFLARNGAAPVRLEHDRRPPEMDLVSGKLRQVRVEKWE